MLEGTATILGYTALPESDLRTRLAYATPALRQVVSIVGAAELPALVAGQSLRFRVRLAPTVRQTGKGEIDALLYAVRQSPDERHDRAAVYADYLTQRLSGAAVETVKMDGFRLAKMVRHTQRMFPVAEMSGVFRVNDAAALAGVVEAGIGRQRAYGFGFIRIEPC